MILETTSGTLMRVSRPSDPYNAYRSYPVSTTAGQRVDMESASALPAFYGAVSLISNVCGTMPLEIVDTRAATGQTIVKGGYLPALLRHAPNEDMSGVDLWVFVFACLLMNGNAYLAKIRDSSGRIVELYPLLPQYVAPYRADGGAKTFRVRIYEGVEYIEADFTPNDILHIKGPSLPFDDPIVGVSAVTLMRHALGTMQAQKEYQARAYQDGMLTKGLLSVPAGMNVSKQSVDRLKQQFKSATQGLRNSHDIAVLHSGASFQAIGMTPEDAQFIETMRWSHTEVATLFNIPSSRLNGDSSTGTYQNQAQDDLAFYQQACRPRVEMVEASLNRDPDLFGAMSAWIPRFDTSAILRADIKTRFEVYQIARDIGAMSANDIRRSEDAPEVEGGDDYTPLAATKTSTGGQDANAT